MDIATEKCFQDFWGRLEDLHINRKELPSPIHTTESLAQKGKVVSLAVDNSVSFHYPHKMGDRKAQLNAILVPLLKWLHSSGVTIHPKLVKSEEMLADSLFPCEVEPLVCMLSQHNFMKLMTAVVPWCKPTVDMFAAPSNTKFRQFCSRWQHDERFLVDALRCSLHEVASVYTYPTW